MIDVTYHASLRPNASSILGFVNTKIEYCPGITPEIIGEQMLHLEEIGVVIVNGAFAHETDLLEDGAKLEFHPYVGGGC